MLGAAFAAEWPDPGQLLVNAGHDPSEHEILLSWMERAPGETVAHVHGLRVRGHDNLPPFDLYFREDGEPLGQSELRELGIAPKQWDAPAAAQPPSDDIPYSIKAADQPRVVGTAPLDLIALPPLDLDAVRAEDAARERDGAKQAQRIGVFREFDGPVTVDGGETSHGAWRTADNGERVWSLSIYSPEAEGLRLEFSRLDLPDGAHVVVYDIFDPDVVEGPFRTIPGGDETLWTPTIFAEEVVVECVVPADATLDGVTIHMDRLAHQYAAFDDLLKRGAGACNLDVACYEDWLQESYGVGGLGTVGIEGTLWCTGSLLAGAQGDDAGRILLTADHCLGSRSAGDVEVYWFYQRDECGGTIPAVSSVPRTTGGADLLVRSPHRQGTDVALLRLRNAAPSGVTALGWSNEAWGPETPVTSIHHPRGSYKRISFGDIEPFDNSDHSSVGPENYIKVVWNEGTTEPGSSGSPMFLEDLGLIIGQLWGGTASCSNPLGPDYYGRFDKSFPLMKNWLFEPVDRDEDVNNDGFVNAVDIQIVINAVLGLPLPDGVTEDDVDVNNDGKVDARDIQRVINAVLGVS